MSELIKFLRFPLMVMVVMIHARMKEISMGGDVLDLQGFMIYGNVSYCISEIFCRIAVPIFYIFSGYLFFFNTSDYTGRQYFQKIRKRTKTLLVPYIFWNLIVILLLFSAQTFMPSFMSGANKLIVDYNISDWVRCFWNSYHGMPVCYQLWFIRDLYVVVLLSPVIYYTIDRWSYYFPIIFGVLYLMGLNSGISGLSVISIFFFYIGAWFSLKKYDIIRFIKKFRTVGYISTLSLVVLWMILYNDIIQLPERMEILVHNLSVLCMILAFLNIVVTIQENKGLKINPLLHDSNFFIYVFHAMPLALIIKLTTFFIDPTSDISVLFIYFFAPLLTITLALLFFLIMKRVFPKFTAIITGSRI